MARAFFPTYHTYTEMVWWFKKWADEYPDLVGLYVAARNFGKVRRKISVGVIQRYRDRKVIRKLFQEVPPHKSAWSWVI